MLAVLRPFQYRDHTWFSMHKRLPGPEGDVENRGRRPRFSTSPEERANVNVLENHVDRCYCINSTKYLLNGKNMALYFVTVSQSTRGSSFFLNIRLPVREHQKIQDGGHHSIRPRCFGNDKLVATQQ